jgi:CheY-like chemotaxis protein
VQSLAGARVLLVEGHPDSLVAFCAILGRGGAETRCVSTAPAARDAARGLHPDVLVADLAAGAELVSDVWRIVGRCVPAICVIANALPRDYDSALAHGFQLILPKPVDPDVLLTVVARLKARVLSRAT